jgi:hypothetical protein
MMAILRVDASELALALADKVGPSALKAIFHGAMRPQPKGENQVNHILMWRCRFNPNSGLNH